MYRLDYVNGALDATDRALLVALADNARTSNAALARQVGLSAPSVAERLRRMEESGVIGRYTIEVAPAALGLPLAAWIRIRPMPGKLATVAELLNELPPIVECDRITGDDCFVARAHVASMAELEALIDRILPHATTNTAIVQSSPVARRLPPVG